MIACSPDNKRIAVTHWGDNTVAIIDIDSENPFDFKYVKHSIVDYKMFTNFGSSPRQSRCELWFLPSRERLTHRMVSFFCLEEWERRNSDIRCRQLRLSRNSIRHDVQCSTFGGKRRLSIY